MKRFSQKKLKGFISLILCLSILLFSDRPLSAAENDPDAPIRVSLLHKYDSADLAVIVDVDTAAHTIRFRNHDTGRDYTLSYDDTTWIYDLYGRPLAANRLPEGEAVDITFLKNSRHLNSAVVSNKVWRSYDITDFDLVSRDELARINGAPFHLDHKALILSDGRSVYPEDILDTDTLFVCGIDKEIYGITVTKGHGYVSLSADQVDEKSLVGAWIELDRQIIRRITPHMLISAPEGNYSLGISGNGARYNSEIVVSRGKETVIDTSVVKVEKPKEGLVTFKVTPASATITVDKTVVAAGVPVSLTYGRHDLTVEAEGYITQNCYLNVAEADATVELSLEKSPDADQVSSNESDSADSGNSNSAESSSESSSADSSGSENSGSSSGESTSDNGSLSSGKKNSGSPYGANTSISDSASAGSAAYDAQGQKVDKASGVTINGYYVTFEAPEGVEAYLDGNYLGVIPLSFTKISGSHTVSLKKKGYKNRSFTIEIDSEHTNVVYSFPSLTKKNKVAEDDDSMTFGDKSTPSASYDSGGREAKSQSSGSSGLGDLSGNSFDYDVSGNSTR